MTEGEDDSRELGVEMGALRESLRNHDYPATTEELVEAYGDEEVELSGGTERLEELLGPLGEEEYESYDEVEQAIMNMVGEEAIGRKNYSDRTPYAPGEERETEGAPGEEKAEEHESF